LRWTFRLLARAPLLTSAAAVLDAAVTESQVAEVINATLDIIKETLVKGGKVQLTGCVAR
jgi:nucleoid DNA-binding protein